MEGHQHPHQHQHHHQYQQQQQQLQQPPPAQQMSGAGVAVEGGGGDRFPQWSVQETKEFLGIRAELDKTFMETKRNKLLWEVISSKMRDLGFLRSAEQCKCKWKNLVTRYKGCETMEPEAMRQNFPFYNEMQSIFTARMQRMLWAETEGGGPGPSSSSKKSKPHGPNMSSDDEDEDDSDGDHKGPKKSKAKKAKIGCGGTSTSSSVSHSSISSINAIKEMLEKFMKQQVEMEVQWREAYEAREEERRLTENEWRQRMEALENERLLMESRWREREEQRRLREDARADQRDALINALLLKLQRDP